MTRSLTYAQVFVLLVSIIFRLFTLLRLLQTICVGTEPCHIPTATAETNYSALLTPARNYSSRCFKHMRYVTSQYVFVAVLYIAIMTELFIVNTVLFIAILFCGMLRRNDGIIHRQHGMIHRDFL